MTIGDTNVQTRILYSIAIMLSTSVLAGSLKRPNGVVVCAKADCPVWHNPCGVSQQHKFRQNAREYLNLNNNIPPVGLRHASARPLRRVRTQLRITHNHFRNEDVQREITFLYSGVENLVRKESEYEWLPGHQFNWYKDNIRCLDKKTKVQVLLPSLHSTLQSFSATFEVLCRLGNSQMALQSIYLKRRKLLTEISLEVKKLLCEVETAIINMGGIDIPERLSLESVESMKWDNRPDHTVGLIQDYGVLVAYRHFLDDWMRIIRRLVGKKSNLQCKPKPSSKKKKKKNRKKPTRQ